MRNIPALSISRPWTTAILRHGKNVENRSWQTNYRGPIYLHAAKSWDPAAAPFDIAVNRLSLSEGMRLAIDEPSRHPTGIVAVARLTGICSVWPDGRGPCDCGAWAARGQYHWQLAGVVALPEPVPCRGFQGLWWPHHRLDEATQAAIRAVTDVDA